MIADISSKTLKRFLESSPLPLTLSSPVFEDCPLVLVNEAFEQLSGYRGEEIIGRNCRFMQGAASDHAARQQMRVAIDNQTETLVKITNYRKNGSLFENFVFIVPIFTEGGTLLYFLGSQCELENTSRGVSAVQHAHALDEAIETSNDRLSGQERLKILRSQSLVRSAEDLVMASR